MKLPRYLICCATLLSFLTCVAARAEERTSSKLNLQRAIDNAHVVLAREKEARVSTVSSGGGHASGPSVKVVLAFTAIGAFIGWGVGASATQHCSCDDPGYGALYGLPIGAGIGAGIGIWLAHK
jgi:hypothetical protein